MKLSTINKIGEFGLIDMIKKMVKLDASVVKGIGDDAAVLNFSRDKYLLLTSDMLIEDVHFKCTMQASNIGHKALACSVSDIAAMGGIPKNAVISLGLPTSLEISFVKDLYKGIANIAKKFKINIVGGDTNRAEKIIIDVTLLGEVEKKNLVLRSTAKTGDLIFITGSLEETLKTGKHLTFKPRLKESRFLVKNYRINSMIDISDGLAQDLGHILNESHKGAVIYQRAILKNKDTSLKEALYGGENYELLFTLSQSQARRLLRDKAKGKIKFPISEIGSITKSKNKLIFIDADNKEKTLKLRGFRHF
ncbi:MAG: thiamine-phosphate kinase [Candidatus Omnitrophica bacterium]|nr:thiamine-phosphate kinase [Candidatus Omnitrophota bacterium]